MLSNTDRTASPFQQNHITPHAVQLAEPLSRAYFAKTALLVKSNACYVIGKYSRLQGPDSIPLSFIDQRFQQHATNAFAARRSSNVYAHFSDSGVNSSSEHRAERRPSNNRIAAPSDESRELQVV